MTIIVLCLGRSARWLPRPKERLWTPGRPIHWIRAIPDQGLRRDVHLAQPGKRPVVHVDLTKGVVVERDPFEHADPVEQAAQVPLDDGAIRERQPNASRSRG